MNIDERQVMGVNVWLKPVEFWFSGAFFIISMPYYLKEASEKKQQAFADVFLICMWVQNILISFQAIRGDHFHFNAADAWEVTMFGLIRLTILLNSLYLLLLLLDIRRTKTGIDRVKKIGMSATLIMVLLASLSAEVISGMLNLTIVFEDGGSGVPFEQWGFAMNNIQMLHFTGLQPMQLFPLLFTFLPLSYRKNGLQLALTIYIALFLWMAVTVFVGMPLGAFQTT